MRVYDSTRRNFKEKNKFLHFRKKFFDLKKLYSKQRIRISSKSFLFFNKQFPCPLKINIFEHHLDIINFTASKLVRCWIHVNMTRTAICGL